MLQGNWTTLDLRGIMIYCVSIYLLLHLYSTMQQTLNSDSDLIHTFTWIIIWAWHLKLWTSLIKRSKFPYTQFNPPSCVYFSHLSIDNNFILENLLDNLFSSSLGLRLILGSKHIVFGSPLLQKDLKLDHMLVEYKFNWLSS